MNTNYIKVGLIATIIIAVCGCSKDSSNNDSPKSGNIKFEDEVVKARLVKRFDLNKDGELSYSEAAAVSEKITITSGGFYDYGFYIDANDLKFFDELKYFTGITKLNLEINTASLQRISIPKNVNNLQLSTSHNTSLKRITCYAETPPQGYFYGKDGFHALINSNCYFYVPNKSLELYKEKIFSINDIYAYTESEKKVILEHIKGF